MCSIPFVDHKFYHVRLMHKYKKEHEYHEQTTTALPYDIMKTLQDNPGVTLIFSYTYQGIDYKVTISGKDAKAYTEIPWYGPLYLYKHYGSSSETAPANKTDTATGERTYTVLPGDTLIGIAGKLNITVESPVSLNDIKNTFHVILCCHVIFPLLLPL